MSDLRPRPLNGYLPIGWTVGEHKAKRESDPKAVEAAAIASMAYRSHGRLLGCRRADARLRQQRRQVAKDEGLESTPSPSPASCRPISALFCRGIRPVQHGRRFRGDPGYLPKTDAKVKELLPDNKHLHNWLDMARERIAFQEPAGRICWVGSVVTVWRWPSTDGQERRALGSVVIGRDHLDSGSVASPNRGRKR